MIVTALTEMFGLKASHCAGADGQCIRWAFGGNRIQRRRTGAGWRRLGRQHLVAHEVVPRLSGNDRLEVNWEATTRDRLWPCAACPVLLNHVVRAKQERLREWKAKRLSRGVGISTFDLYFVQPSTDQKIQAPLHVVGQAGRSLHFSRSKQFARSVGVSLPMQLFSHCSLHSSWVPPEPLNS